LEAADPVARALTHGDIDQPFPARAIDNQRVLQNAEINEPATGVKLRDFLAQILRVLRIVELAAAGKKKAFRLGVHRGNNVGIGNSRIAIDANAGDRQTPSLVDPEVDRKL